MATMAATIATLATQTGTRLGWSIVGLVIQSLDEIKVAGRAALSDPFPLSPCTHGERVRVRGIFRTSERLPLTLALSPEYQGEGKRNHHRTLLHLLRNRLTQQPCRANK